MTVSEARRDRRGTTLVEVMVYMLIASTVASVFGYFVADMLFTRSRIAATLEVQENARLAIDRVVNEVRHAKSADATSSYFAINLAAPENAGKSVSFTMSSSTLSPTVFDVYGGVLRIRQGSAATATPVTSDYVKLTDLTFRNLESKKARSVTIDMTVAFAEPIPGQTVGATSTLRSSATLMNR